MRVPETLRFYGPPEIRHEVEEFIGRVEHYLSLDREVVLDFSKTKLLYPCGALVFMGVVDNWLGRFPGALTGRYPDNDLVEQMLQHVSVLQKLGLTPRKTVDHHDVIRWSYFTGTQVDLSGVELFLDEMRALIGHEAQAGLAECISEAVTNVKHHAYDGESDGRWWMFATVSSKHVFVAIYDRGASIPATLLEKPQVGDIFKGRRWGRSRDARLLSAAVGGRTSTGLAYRGKGLPEMLDFTRAFPTSELGIFSRRGFFRYATGDESISRLSNPMVGTLIIWMLKFDGATS